MLRELSQKNKMQRTLPQSKFYELGKRLIFFVIEDSYWHLCNASENCEDNFLFYSGLKFPIEESDNTTESEVNAARKNAEAIKKWKENRLAQLTTSPSLAALHEEIAKMFLGLDQLYLLCSCWIDLRPGHLERSHQG